jgi:2-C-methyl-D-erythritol 2,4-cyclodiphosphate synthase
MRIGQDSTSTLVAGKARRGGVEIPHDGPARPCDADVLHAICDALLGAAAHKGDIGRHFPDSDARYKGHR